MKNILLLIISLFFISCSTSYSHYTKKISSYFSSNEKTIDFLDITNKLVEPLCEKLNQNTTIYITDFVNEKNLKNKSQLGFLLSNQTKVNVLDESCSIDVQIQDLQLSKNIKLSKNGSRILTRDIKDIKINSIEDDKQILIGTYLITNQQIIFFLKLVDLQSGNIIATTTTSKLLNDEFKTLEGIKTNKELKEEMEQSKIYTPMHL